MCGRKVINRKGSRTNTLRVSRPRKRVRPTNQHEIEDETASTSASAKKLKTSDLQNIPIVATQGYRIINFVMVFSALSNIVKCKICNGNIDFAEASTRGLGFKLLINCEKCDRRYISSCPLIGKAYEINRRIVFTMKLLGVGYEGIRKFCGFMDMPRIFTKSIYNKIVKSIRISSEEVFSLLISKAAAEEKRLTSRAENTPEIAGLTVSGDGTWRKRGFSSKYGVTTVIAQLLQWKSSGYLCKILML